MSRHGLIARRALVSLVSLVPLGLALPVSVFAQPVECFRTVQAPPWIGLDVGDPHEGSSRATTLPGAGREPFFELCSAGAGFGEDGDQLRFLYQGARGDYDVIARLDALEGGGLGGVMARLEPRLEDSAYIQVSVEATAAAGPMLHSSYRSLPGFPASSGGVKPVPVQLPVYLRISRSGARLTTSYSRDGREFTTHLEVSGRGTDLELIFQRVGMVQASASTRLPSIARFFGPRVSVGAEELAPVIAGVEPATSPVDGGVEVTIHGEGLAGVVEASLAGIPAEVIAAEEDRVVVLAGPADGPRTGDVRVATRTSSQVLRDAFAYVGRLFIRGDFNGSMKADLSDAVAQLDYLFKGGPPPLCDAVGDINGDGRGDLSDSVFLLGHLFLGTLAPSAPYPEPGLEPGDSAPCGLPAPPVVRSIQPAKAGPGDIVTIMGSGFGDEPERNVVFFGPSHVRVLRGSDRELIVQVDEVLRAGEVSVAIFHDFADKLKSPFTCGPDGCRRIVISPAVLAAAVKVHLEPAGELPRALGESSVDARGGEIRVALPRQLWDPTATYEVRASLLLPAVQGLSPGARLASFEFSHYDGDTSYEEWVDVLADELQRTLEPWALRRRGVEVISDPAKQQLLLRLDRALVDASIAELPSSFLDILFRPAVGRCGPESLHPIQDRRAFGWCRLEELLKPCNGFPAWEHFIPKPDVLSTSEDIFPLTAPGARSTFQKSIMYNESAYCFVRQKKLWNRCVLADMESAGKKQVPHFPRSAIVVKTAWRTAAQLPANPHPDTLYYHYTLNGTRQYLVAFHFTTKDIDQWYWADFYVPASSGGLGGCGGSNADRPASIGGIWANYYMCTNVDEDDPICGNSVFPECNVSNCIACHKHTPDGSGPFGTGAAFGEMGLDFLFSLADGVQDPPGCP